MDYPDEKRFAGLTLHLLAAYALLRRVLHQLPVPIGLPGLDSKEWDIVAALQAIEHTRTELIKDEPLDEPHKGRLRRMLLDWITAYEVGTLIQNLGPAEFRFDAMEYALDRIVTFADLLAEELGIELGPEAESE